MKKIINDMLKITLTITGLGLIAAVIYFLFTAEFVRALGSFLALLFVSFLLHEDKK